VGKPGPCGPRGSATYALITPGKISAGSHSRDGIFEKSSRRESYSTK